MTKDSRLERFLKALCSLDYSDLPTPLSRVEVLWNCLITGEATPDFQPQSRTEKYLMSILGVYDLEDIPKPISRVETLLYKLATGDTDVKLEDGAKSRYERLLSEIVANGGVGDNVDFEYVTYVLSESFNTLYNTVDKSVKSAILKGQTLVNLNTNKSRSKVLTPEINNDRFYNFNIPYVIQSNTDFTIKGKCDNQSTSNVVLEITYSDNTYSYLELLETGKSGIFDKRYNRTKDIKSLRLYLQNNATGNATISDVVCVIGNMINKNIPYFTGMQSVKMPVLTTTGKNLFNKNNIIVDGYIISNGTLVYETGDNRNAADFIEVEPNCIYSISGIKNSAINGGRTHQYVGMYDKNKRFISSTTIYCLSDSATFTTTENTKYIRVSVRNDDINRLQIEKGTTTTYEPHKSNILTVNEPVELRGIGEVKDELNLLTGELTQRIGEVVLDGSEEWIMDLNGVGVRRYYLEGVGGDLSDTVSNSSSLLCDKFEASLNNMWFEKNDSTQIIKSNGIYFIDSSVDSLDAFVNKLKTTNIKVQYSLIEKPVKTVDLITLDQDGNETKLKTFNDITHVSLSSEGLIPDAEMTVATKNLDDISQASTMSLRMNDISNRQNELQNEVDTQSESIDSTMMATTEIYEQTL